MKLGSLSPIMKTWSPAYTDDPLHCYECHKLYIFKVSGSLIAPRLFIMISHNLSMSVIKCKAEAGATS